MNWKQKYKIIRWLQKPSKVEPAPTTSQVAMKAVMLLDKVIESKHPRLKLMTEMEGFDVWENNL